MKTTTTAWLLACTLTIGISAANAQSTIGGARQQQNKIGGVAKPQPVVGGATVHANTPPKTGAVVSMSRPGTSPGTAGAAGASTQPGQTAGNTRPNPPV